MTIRRILDKDIDFPDTGCVWVHVKSGGRYVVVCPCIIEATLEPAVAYCKSGEWAQGLMWIRPVSEFMDGRFVKEE